MNIVEKIKKSWWVIISIIPFLNGFGFVYIGLKNNNRYWVLEGVMYEVPWLFSIILAGNGAILDVMTGIASIVMLVSIIRSIWLAIKLADVYDNEDKYTVRPTAINNHNNPQQNEGSSSSFICCLCIIVIFVAFGLVAIIL